MSKYRLSYIMNGTFNNIDLSKLDCLKDKVETDIVILDNFTMNFKSKIDLKAFLVRNELLKKEFISSDLYITIDRKDSETNKVKSIPIINAKELVLENTSDNYSVNYATTQIRNNMMDVDYMIKLIGEYYNKKGSIQMDNILNSIKRILNNLKNNKYLDNEEKCFYLELVENFIDIEFYKIKNKRRVINYRGLHDFIVINNKVLNINKTVELDNIDYDEDEEKEEFLEEKDFIEINKTLSNNYKNIIKEQKSDDVSLPTKTIYDSLQYSSKLLCRKGK